MNEQSKVIKLHNQLIDKVKQILEKKDLFSISFNEPPEILFSEFDHNGEFYYTAKIITLDECGNMEIELENGDSSNACLSDIVKVNQVAMLLDMIKDKEFKINEI